MPDGLYERDFLEWSERQADLLRRLAAGERGFGLAQPGRRGRGSFPSDAADRWAPSMEQRVDFAMLYQRARARTTVTTAGGQDPAWLPAENPFAISELIVAAPGIADVCALVAKLDTVAASADPARNSAS